LPAQSSKAHNWESQFGIILKEKMANFTPDDKDAKGEQQQ